MKLYLLCLFVAIATAARPYRYTREEYLPSRRYLRGAASAYSRPPRPIMSLEEEPYHVVEPKTSFMQQQSDENVKKDFSQARIGKSLTKEEVMKSYAAVEQAPAEEAYEEKTKESEPAFEEESQENNEDYQSYFDEFGDEDYEKAHGSHDEHEAEEEDEYDEDDDYRLVSDYRDNDYEEHEEEREEELGEAPAEMEDRDADEMEQRTMSTELADKVFSFPNCDSITCSKAGFEGYGCMNSKCKFICSKSECYEYPNGPTDLGESEDEEEVQEEETTTTTEELTTTTEATTTTTTPEPETTTQAVRRRRPSSDKRGKVRRARTKQ